MTERVVDSYHSPRNAIPMNWGTSGTVWTPGGSNPFSVVAQDPNTNKFPPQYATGRAGMDGNFCIGLTGGFTAPVTLTAWEWNPVSQSWMKLGGNAAQYDIVYDATYAIGLCKVSESALVLVQSSIVVTGTAYTDMHIETVGAAQEGF